MNIKNNHPSDQQNTSYYEFLKKKLLEQLMHDLTSKKVQVLGLKDPKAGHEIGK